MSRAAEQARRARRRAAELGYEGENFTPRQWRRLLKRTGHRCLSCGAAEDLSVDHVHPLSKGGSNALSNIQVLCCACNSLKSDSTHDYRRVWQSLKERR